jgi:hypothetical protein
LGNCEIVCGRREPSVFVRSVPPAERQHLEAGLRPADAFRRRRSQSVRASGEGAGVPRRARQGGCREQAVRNVVPRCNAQGVACLQRPSSRPPAPRERGGSEGAQRLQALLPQSPRPFGYPTSLWT